MMMALPLISLHVRICERETMRSPPYRSRGPETRGRRTATAFMRRQWIRAHRLLSAKLLDGVYASAFKRLTARRAYFIINETQELC